MEVLLNSTLFTNWVFFGEEIRNLKMAAKLSSKCGGQPRMGFRETLRAWEHSGAEGGGVQVIFGG